MSLTIADIKQYAKDTGIALKWDTDWQELILLPDTPQSEHFDYSPSGMDRDERQWALEEVRVAIERLYCEKVFG